MKFVKNKKEWNIETIFEKKINGFDYYKRVLIEDLSSLPFGY